MEYDLIVIGSGPGGYAAAIRAGQLGMKTGIIEKDPVPGGTCLNIGCIPSKALLDTSEMYHMAAKKMRNAGVLFDGLSYDWDTIQKNKDRVVSENVKGVEFLLKKNKVDFIQGIGTLLATNRVGYTDPDGKEHELNAKNVILATGSVPAELPGVPFDEAKGILSSTHALSLKKVPEKMLVIGGGVIGLEMGSIYHRMGSEVTILEGTDRLLPEMDGQISREMERFLKKEKIKIHTNALVQSVEGGDAGVHVIAKNSQGEEQSYQGDVCLIAIGRRPRSKGLDAGGLGLAVTERGFVQVDGDLRTSLPRVYAIGDLVGGAMLAHKAREEGVAVAERIAGQKPHISYHSIPGVVYTWPEAAGAGKTEEALKKENRGYRTGNFPYRALGRARASGDLDGFVKILSDEKTDEVLGIHIFGARAADLIGEAVMALEYRASAEDIARICHAHPTFSEGMQEAALEATGIGAIHK